MKFVIKHEIRGRVRTYFYQKGMNIRQADLLHYYPCISPRVKNVGVYERTADAAVMYEGSRRCMLEGIQGFSYDSERMEELVLKNSGRALNRGYKKKLVRKAVVRASTKSFLPVSVRAVYTTVHSVRYLLEGICCLLGGKLEMEVLDVAAIAAFVLRRDFDTAGSVMFPLGVGGLLEEWTRKKSVSDFARSVSLNTSGVQQDVDGTEVLVPVSKIREGDLVTAHMRNVIPLDGVVASGGAMVNQISMTGGSVPVRKKEGSYAYARTAVEEGEITLRMRTAVGDTGFKRTATMIEESEQLKSTAEGKAATLTDVLVPRSLGGTILTWLLVHNATRALSILMVDFSYTLKLVMPLFVLSAMRETGSRHTTVKGGRYMGAAVAANAIVFDKIGTLTKARPQVADVAVFNDMGKGELLRITICLGKHFPHSMAKAAVDEAVKRGLVYEEAHSRVGYIITHGIVTYVGDGRMAIRDYHFMSEDEGCRVPGDKRTIFDSLPVGHSYLYLAIRGSPATVVCTEDPLKDGAGAVITALHRQGITKIVMMIGDNEHTAVTVVGRMRVDEYYSEVLPESKARLVDEGKKKSRKVIMTGDGINDSPALSATDAGIAISEEAEIVREIADITISEDNPFQLVILRAISWALINRIDRDYKFVIRFNLGLILPGVGGVTTPTASAMLHNAPTLAISLKSTTNFLD